MSPERFSIDYEVWRKNVEALDWTCSYTVVTMGNAMDLVVEWDEGKNGANRKKHGVAFEEARSAFLDENARVLADPEHSAEEDRYVLLGMSTSLRILLVCHCYREAESVIRIISARKADQDEQRQYRRWLR